MLERRVQLLLDQDRYERVDDWHQPARAMSAVLEQSAQQEDDPLTDGGPVQREMDQELIERWG